MSVLAKSPKTRAEAWAITGAAGLALLKLGVGVVTNSIALVSTAADSLMDVLLSTLNLLSIRFAESPADEGHPYGHGKIENLAGLAQGTVIALVGGWVIWEAVRRLTLGIRPVRAEWGIAVMVLSILVSWGIAHHLRRVGRETDSVVLLADSLHYATDVWINGGVLAALLVLRLTGVAVFDPLIATAVGGLILFSAYQVLARSVGDLMDAALPEAEQREIARIIRHHAFVVSSHDLRTRRAGSERQIDFSVVLCRHLPLGEAHDLVDHVEKEVERAIGHANVVVHAEPCPPDCKRTDRCVLWASDADLLAHEPRHEASGS